MLSDVGRGGLASVLDVQSLFFLFKKIGFARWQDIEIDLLKLDVQGQGGGRILDVDRQEGWGVLKIVQFSWTSYVYHP